ncbi:MAG: GGDEF domain-containing protein [Gammaproteobacteria bacterium]|nr:GGDEF domain-containing protein [Gammaproteobacteria bacterium]MCF6231134.1 GGDEF domain-containing protein [Gammaproteobacteria bacterium]
MGFKKYNIPLALLTLAITLSSLSLYNYNTQKDLLLHQMQSDAGDIVSSIIASIDRFHEVKSTMSLQKLMREVSLGLEIFEFRYIEPDGTISNSMFKEEIGTQHHRKGFEQVRNNPEYGGEFFFEERDYVSVMAIYYPLQMNGRVVGYIDLSVDISEYDIIAHDDVNFSLLRRQVDILNLLKAIEGSVKNSLDIFQTIDIHTFLESYVESAQNIIQLAIVNENGEIIMSSNASNIGERIDFASFDGSRLMHVDNKLVYRILASEGGHVSVNDERLLLLIDATPYAANKQKLLVTAMATSGAAIIFALFIAYTIYRYTREQSLEENRRLEAMVKERTQEIELLSRTDALTGLWNRGYLEEMLAMEFKRAHRYHHELALLIIDLDLFKRINDNYGHLAGDEVLRQASARILNSLRETDFVGRYGGEEIVVILTETNTQYVNAIANKVRNAIGSTPVKLDNNGSITVTASIGVSYLIGESQTVESLFKEADEALYQAKESGRNQVVVYSPNQGD